MGFGFSFIEPFKFLFFFILKEYILDGGGQGGTGTERLSDVSNEKVKLLSHVA